MDISYLVLAEKVAASAGIVLLTLPVVVVGSLAAGALLWWGFEA